MPLEPPRSWPVGTPLPSFRPPLASRSLSGGSAVLSVNEVLKANFELKADTYFGLGEGIDIEALLGVITPGLGDVGRIIERAGVRQGIWIAMLIDQYWIEGPAAPFGRMAQIVSGHLFSQAKPRLTGRFFSNSEIETGVGIGNRFKIRIPHE